MTIAVINSLKSMLNQYCKDLTLESYYPVTSPDAGLSLRNTTIYNGVHAWSMVYASIPVSGVLEQRKFATLLDAMRNGNVPFDWIIPLHSTPQGVADSNPAIYAAATSGTYYVVIDRDNTVGDFLQVGDIVKFSNHNKVYRVMSITNELHPTVTLNCPLVKSVTTSDTMITRDVPMRVKMRPKSEPVVYKREAGDLDAEFEFELIEDLT